MQQFEWHVRNKLASQSSAVQLHSYGVRYHDTNSISWALALRHQGRACEVDVILLKVAVQGDAC